MRPAILIAALVLLTACAPSFEAPEGPPATGGGQNEPGCVCIQLYDPVCGSDGRTYSNSCFAGCAKVDSTPGACA